jgi:hypothetical protein
MAAAVLAVGTPPEMRMTERAAMAPNAARERRRERAVVSTWLLRAPRPDKPTELERAG